MSTTSAKNPIVYRVITWLPVGGIERRLVSIMPRLRDRGFDMRLVCIRELGPLAQELQDQGISVTLVPMKSRLDPVGILKLRQLFKSEQADLIHAHMYRSAVPATIAGHFAKTPVIFSQVHNVGTWESKRQAGMDRFLAKWRTGMITVSKSVQTDVCNVLGLGEEKVPVLYNGSDTDKFKPDLEARTRGRVSLGVEDHRPVVLVPARLHSNKNPEGVLKAFLAARQKLENDPLLVFAGPGPLTDQMESLIKELQAEDCVRLLGSRDDMVDLYNACDVMLLSTFKEGFSNSIVEALACGKPVIAADVGGNAEAVDRSEVGWIHQAGDSETLTAQLIEALSHPEKLSKMSDDCRQQGLRFSLDALVNQTDELYRTALAKAGIL